MRCVRGEGAAVMNGVPEFCYPDGEQIIPIEFARRVILDWASLRTA